MYTCNFNHLVILWLSVPNCGLDNYSHIGKVASIGRVHLLTLNKVFSSCDSWLSKEKEEEEEEEEDTFYVIHGSCKPSNLVRGSTLLRKVFDNQPLNFSCHT